MATVKFFTKGDNNPSTIYVRLRAGRSVDISLSTNYVVNPKFWNNTIGKVKIIAGDQKKAQLVENLNLLESTIFDKLNGDKAKGRVIDKLWLEQVIHQLQNPNINNPEEAPKLIELIVAYEEEMRVKINPKTGKRIADTTLRNFKTTIRRVKLFEEHKRHSYFLFEVDLNFHSEFIKFLRNNQNLAQNSISKDIKQIKTICIDARDKGHKINEQVLSRKFNAPLEPTTFVTISEKEIELIKQFKGKDYLENARDWLVVGCWTGCRVRDLMQLSIDNIHTNPKKQRFIRYTQSKTNKQVDLPIHPDVDEILKKRKGFPRPISDQRFNEWIKDVCEASGLVDMVKGTRQNPNTHKKEVGMFKKYELIRSHTCRRSFATNHYNKLPNKLIMAVTGHSTEKMLLHYIGETENAHLDDFMSVWGNN